MQHKYKYNDLNWEMLNTLYTESSRRLRFRSSRIRSSSIKRGITANKIRKKIGENIQIKLQLRSQVNKNIRSKSPSYSQLHKVALDLGFSPSDAFNVASILDLQHLESKILL